MKVEAWEIVRQHKFFSDNLNLIEDMIARDAAKGIDITELVEDWKVRKDAFDKFCKSKVEIDESAFYGARES